MFKGAATGFRRFQLLEFRKKKSFCCCSLFQNLNLLNQQFGFDSFQQKHEAVFEMCIAVCTVEGLVY